MAFNPPLPSYKRQVISRMAMGNLVKIFLEFPQVFWDEEPQYISYFSVEGTFFPLFENGKYWV